MSFTIDIKLIAVGIKLYEPFGLGTRITKGMYLVEKSSFEESKFILKGKPLLLKVKVIKLH